MGYGDGSIRVFDLRSAEVTHNVSGQNGHSAAVASLDVKRDNNLIASGGVDGVAKLYSLQSSKVVGCFQCGAESGEGSKGEEDGDDDQVSSKATVESVLFGSAKDQSVLVTGSLEGIVNIWDMSTQVGIA